MYVCMYVCGRLKKGSGKGRKGKDRTGKERKNTYKGRRKKERKGFGGVEVECERGMR